ncbi:MAG: hypothetical protein ABEJ93_01040 [Candidatus Nanohalobium sp.]
MKYREALEQALEELEQILGEEIVKQRVREVKGLEYSDGELEIEGDEEKSFFRFLADIRMFSGNNEVYVIARNLEENSFKDIAEKTRYWVLMQEILDREENLLGKEEALEQVGKVEGLQREGSILVKCSGECHEMMSDLIDSFKEKQGEVAPFLISQRLSNIMTSDIEPPEELAGKI